MLKRLRIGQKLSILLLLATVSSLVLGTIGAVGMLRIRNSQELMYQMAQNMHEIELVAETVYKLRLELRRGVAYIQNEDEARLQTCINTLRDCDRELAALTAGLRDTLYTQDGLSLLEQIIEEYNQLESQRDLYETALRTGDVEGANAWMALYVEPYNRIQEKCLKLSTLCIELIEDKNRQDLALSNLLITSQMILFVSAVASILLLGGRISRAITRPVEKLIKITEQLVKGNVTAEFNIKSNDEIGKLAASMREAVEGDKHLAHVLAALAGGGTTPNRSLPVPNRT